MLLLLGLLQFPLRTVFDFFQGPITQPRAKAGVSGNGFDYRVIYSGDFSSCEKEIELESLTTTTLSKPIKETRILQKEDYLISYKGGIKGISMYHTLKKGNDNKLPVAASNNLIVVRPKPESAEGNGTLYMHNLLDLILQHLIKKDKEQPEGQKTTLISQHFLEEFNIQHIDMQTVKGYQERFREISNRWEKAYEHLQSINKELNGLNKEIGAGLFNSLGNF